MTDRFPTQPETEQTQKNKWDIESLRDNEKRLREDITKIDNRITSEIREVNQNFSREIKSIDRKYEQEIKEANQQIASLLNFKVEILQKLAVAFHRIDDLRDSDTWLKRTFGATLIGGIFSAILGLIVWFIQN